MKLHSPFTAIDRLRLFLRPPGKGLLALSGGGLARPLLWALYGTDAMNQIQSAWEDSLQRIRRVSTILVGIPTDTGAGLARGAAFGPIGIRQAYLEHFGAYPKSVVDVGDVLCVPPLLHDEMLSEGQLLATRRELYPALSDADLRREPLPASPLSISEHVLMALHELNPEAQVVLLGGDQSVTWPAMLYCQKRCGSDFGVVHYDSEADLVPNQFGIRFGSSSWAFHAAKLMKSRQLVQIGIRPGDRMDLRSGNDSAEDIPTIQFGAEVMRGSPNAIIEKVIQHFTDLGVRRLYLSNDVSATLGSPEASISPDLIFALNSALRSQFTILGGDIVEVAPALMGSRDFGGDPVCRLGANYLHGMISVEPHLNAPASSKGDSAERRPTL